MATARSQIFDAEDDRGRLDSSLGYVGLDIRLPALQRYEAEASGAYQLTPITEHLYNTLNRSHGPNKVYFSPTGLLQTDPFPCMEHLAPHESTIP